MCVRLMNYFKIANHKLFRRFLSYSDHL